MSKLSNKIRNEAKLQKKNGTTNAKKLTKIQDDLALESGFDSFSKLIAFEKKSQIDERIKFAKPGNQESDDHFLLINDHVEVFVRKDGFRGLRALKNFNKKEIIFVEKPLISVSKMGQTEVDLAWAATFHLVSKQQNLLNEMRSKYRYRESFQPVLDVNDKAILKEMAKLLDKSEREINSVYNLVCTYNTMSTLGLIYHDTNELELYEKLFISIGLSYANHSCEPNSARIEIKTLEWFQSNFDGLVAIENISQGDEITWGYWLCFKNKRLKNRRKTLLNEFGFNCTCARCEKEKKSMK